MRNTILVRNAIAGASCMLVSAASVLACGMAVSTPTGMFFSVFFMLVCPISFVFGISYFSERVKTDETKNTNS